MAEVAAPTPYLIIITGPVASGKTTLSQRLARDVQLPLLNRDRFKEVIFDALGWSDRAWSQRVGVTSYRLLYYSLEALLHSHRSCIVESNFQADYDTPKLRELCQRFGYQPLQLCCTAQQSLLLERYVKRISEGQRHPGHADEANITVLQQARWNEVPEILDIGGSHLILDTSSQESFNYADVLLYVQQHLEKA